MPYFVYAIHTDSRVNRLCGSFADYNLAEMCQRDNEKSKDPGHPRLVMMIYAENKGHALQRLRAIRREQGLPTH